MGEGLSSGTLFHPPRDFFFIPFPRTLLPRGHCCISLTQAISGEGSESLLPHLGTGWKNWYATADQQPALEVWGKQNFPGDIKDTDRVSGNS